MPTSNHAYDTAYFCQSLEALVATDTGIQGALVCSSDGFEIASFLPAEFSQATLSAMASSQLALSGAMSTEANLGQCRNLVIDCDRGRLLIMHVPDSGGGLLLAVLATAKYTLGEALWACRNAAADIGQSLTGAMTQST